MDVGSIFYAFMVGFVASAYVFYLSYIYLTIDSLSKVLMLNSIGM
jgi:hypothetical protein